jgi:hypothetical protein
VRVAKAAAAERKGRLVHGVGDLGQKQNGDGEAQNDGGEGERIFSSPGVQERGDEGRTQLQKLKTSRSRSGGDGHGWRAGARGRG